MTAFFQKESATQFTIVPYRGGAPAIQDLVAGQIDLFFNPSDALPLVRAGSLKAYAVTGDTHLAVAPDIPTFSEMGLPAVSYLGWYGLFAPRGTPKDIIGKLNAAAVEALADPAVQSRLIDLGMEIFPRDQQTPEALDALVKTGAKKCGRSSRSSGSGRSDESACGPSKARVWRDVVVGLVPAISIILLRA